MTHQRILLSRKWEIVSMEKPRQIAQKPLKLFRKKILTTQNGRDRDWYIMISDVFPKSFIELAEYGYQF